MGSAEEVCVSISYHLIAACIRFVLLLVVGLHEQQADERQVSHQLILVLWLLYSGKRLH